MKVVITHLKAPWPEGAKPGDVCELPGDSIPGWATGKCTEAAGDAEAQFTWEPPATPVEAESKPVDTDELASLKAMLDGGHAAACTVSQVPGHFTPQKLLLRDAAGVVSSSTR